MRRTLSFEEVLLSANYGPSQSIAQTMNLNNYVVVGHFSNDTDQEMRIFLEMTCEEIFLLPGHKIELFAKRCDGLFPITVNYLSDGLQIFADEEFDVDWHIRFDGKFLKPSFPTRLSEI